MTKKLDASQNVKKAVNKAYNTMINAILDYMEDAQKARVSFSNKPLYIVDEESLGVKKLIFHEAFYTTSDDLMVDYEVGFLKDSELTSLITPIDMFSPGEVYEMIVRMNFED